MTPWETMPAGHLRFGRASDQVRRQSASASAFDFAIATNHGRESLCDECGLPLAPSASQAGRGCRCPQYEEPVDGWSLADTLIDATLAIGIAALLTAAIFGFTAEFGAIWA